MVAALKKTLNSEGDYRLKVATPRPVEFIATAEDMQSAQNHPHLHLLNTEARVLELYVLHKAKRIVRSYFADRGSRGTEQDSVPPLAAASLAVTHYCYGWIHAERTRALREITTQSRLNSLREMVSQAIAMCSGLRDIVNDWPASPIHPALTRQYEATKQFYSDLNAAVVALEEGWEPECF